MKRDQQTDRKQWLYDLNSVFPPAVGKALQGMEPALQEQIEEIRLRGNRPLALYARGENLFLSETGKVVPEPEQAYVVTEADCREFLLKASRHSVYMLEEEMRRGFITLKGGYRVGIGGKAVLERGSVRLLSPCTGFNIRIARQIFGAADRILPQIISGGRVLHTLVVSPPQKGKTTMLRDLARQLSNRRKGYKVVIVDERSEIAGCYNGIPQNDVGYQTDVLDGCPKAEGMMMALRGLSPQVIITDELGRAEDAAAVLEAVNGGVSVIASAHAAKAEELLRRPGIGELMRTRAFERVVVLGGEEPGRITGLLDGELREVGRRL